MAARKRTVELRATTAKAKKPDGYPPTFLSYESAVRSWVRAWYFGEVFSPRERRLLHAAYKDHQPPADFARHVIMRRIASFLTANF